ncbi:MAG: type II secretion system F family protein [Clostridia bacterium]|nr:type II secretion system F family protein [Clostridia bacterium]
MAVLFDEFREQILLSRPRTPAQALALFAYQTGAMLEAGLPLLAALELNREQAPEHLRTALLAVEQDLKEGSSLAKALSKHPRVFPPLLVSMVEAGELGGILPKAFSWLADHYEREDKLFQQIKSALAYPVLVLILTLVCLLIMFVLVLPNFAHLLSNMGTELPLLTKMVLGISNLLVKRGSFLLLLVITGFGILYIFLQRPAGRLWWDNTLLNLPLIGSLALKVISVRFCRILGALLHNGVPILQAVNVVKKTLGNQVLEHSLSIAEASLKEGQGLAKPLAQEKLFPSLVVQLVTSGEETGQLPQFLLKLSDYYDREVERTLEKVVALLEPVLVLLLGIFVGGIVIALLLPMFSLFSSL